MTLVYCAPIGEYYSPLVMFPDNVDIFVLACKALHNFAKMNYFKRWHCLAGFVYRESDDCFVHRGDYRKNISSHTRRSFYTAMGLGDKLADYFLNEAAKVLPAPNDLIFFLNSNLVFKKNTSHIFKICIYNIY